MRLITYTSIGQYQTLHGYVITDATPVEWLLKTQEYPETYFILNVLEVSDHEGRVLREKGIKGT